MTPLRRLYGLLPSSAMLLAVVACSSDGDDGDCADDEFLDQSYHWCGAPPEGEDDRFCAARPTTCTEEYAPVCGCDGVVYGNTCSAHSAGVDTGAAACDASATPGGYFPCGHMFCGVGPTFCLLEKGDQADRQFTCQPLPAACESDRTCGCLEANVDRASSCEDVTGNGGDGWLVTEVLL